MPRISSFIFGLHDVGGEKLMLDAKRPGWVVHSALVGDAPGDFSALFNAGIAVIVRLNHGYSSDGTIPPATEYDKFAQACGQYVASSRGANIWIIGNETNARAERPGNGEANPGQVITPASYATCFSKCRTAIRNLPGHSDDWVIPAAVAPWNIETTYSGNPTGNWLHYFRDLMMACIDRGAPPDAIALHTFTHGGDKALILNEDLMPPSFPSSHFNFRTYRDFMAVIPEALRSKPALITETRPIEPDGWHNCDVGWVQAAYAEIDAWNKLPANQAIQALVLFRWQTGQAVTSLSDKTAALQDLKAAMRHEYRVRLASEPPQALAVAPAAAPSGWCPFARRRVIRATNYSSGREGHKVKAVVLHIAVGPMTAVFNTFNNPRNRASAHFCIGKNGAIEQYVSIHDTAYGNGVSWVNGRWITPSKQRVKPPWVGLIPGFNPNLYTISIEHEGYPQETWTPEMYAANNRLLQWIGQQCNLTFEPHRTLIGHHEINPVDRPNCPGPNVNYQKMATDANAGLELPDRLEAIKAAAVNVRWLSININSALFKYALGHNLGYPLTDEFEFRVGNETRVGQRYALGIVHVKKNDWANVKLVPKSAETSKVADRVTAAAIAAATKQPTLKIDPERALYKYALVHKLELPQTGEFEFQVAGDTYIGQVFRKGFVYALKQYPESIRTIAKNALALPAKRASPSTPPTTKAKPRLTIPGK